MSNTSATTTGAWPAISRDENHVYTLPDGSMVPSVTTITSIVDKSGPLVGWAVRETCNFIEAQFPMDEGSFLIGPPTLKDVISRARKEATRQKTEAADRGTKVHDLVEAEMKMAISGEGHAYPLSDPQVLAAFEAFLTWRKEYRFVPVHSEQMVYSTRRRYAGTLDLIGTMSPPGSRARPRMYLVDVKSSNGFYPDSMIPQLAAYAHGVREHRPDLKIEGIGIIRCDKTTGVPSWHDCTDRWRWGWRTFKAMRALYALVKESDGTRQRKYAGVESVCTT